MPTKKAPPPTHLHPRTNSTEIAVYFRRLHETPEQEKAHMQGVADLARRMDQIDANLERGHVRESEPVSPLSWLWLALCGFILLITLYALGLS